MAQQRRKPPSLVWKTKKKEEEESTWTLSISLICLFLFFFSSSRFVGNVMVQDLQTEQKWYFLCNSWLAIDIDDCLLDEVFPVSSEVDLKSFR